MNLNTEAPMYLVDVKQIRSHIADCYVELLDCISENERPFETRQKLAQTIAQAKLNQSINNVQAQYDECNLQLQRLAEKVQSLKQKGFLLFSIIYREQKEIEICLHQERQIDQEMNQLKIKLDHLNNSKAKSGDWLEFMLQDEGQYLLKELKNKAQWLENLDGFFMLMCEEKVQVSQSVVQELGSLLSENYLKNWKRKAEEYLKKNLSSGE